MLPRTRVKICGITNIADAKLAVDLGADALGFIFFRQSPRYITPIAVKEIITNLPPFVTPVAVVVNESMAEVSSIMEISGCQIVQLHGAESPTFLERLAWPAIKSISVETVNDLVNLSLYHRACAILLDTKVTGLYGGTGATFDWEIVREARNFKRPVILAGGLSPENIVEALRVAQPDAIDISSGIEYEPGKKDAQRMSQLFHVIRRYDDEKTIVPSDRVPDRR